MAACHPAWVAGVIATWSILLFVAEISIGLKSHSLGPIVHGLHTLFIAIEETICIVTQKIPMTSSKTNTFGWGRSQILGVAVNSVFLGALNFSMVISALKRFAAAEHLHDPLLIVIVGAVATVADIFMLVFALVNKLLQSRKQNKRESVITVDECEDLMINNNAMSSRKTQSDSICNIRRTVTNLMGAIVIIIAGIVRVFYHTQHWTVHADTVASLLVVTIIFVGTFPKLKNACLVLLQAAPGNMTVVELQEKLLNAVPGIINVHEFHIWQLTNDHVVATVHLCCKNGDDFTRLSDQVRLFLIKQGIHKVTIQPEFTELSADQFKTLRRNNSSQCELDCGPSCAKSKCCSFEESPEDIERLKRSSMVCGDTRPTSTISENGTQPCSGSGHEHDHQDHGHGHKQERYKQRQSRDPGHGHDHDHRHGHSHDHHGHSHGH